MPLPPPPPPPPSFNESLSPFLVIMFFGLALSTCFICYLSWATRYRRGRTSRHNTNQQAYEDMVHEDLGPVIHNPIWLINTRGLDQIRTDRIDPSFQV
ncbi:hypothetical protein QVD17_37220 [Tagetes erecta]|uniref:Uncharacterized protein n=1 Tax=Tagetes erecta TaxID=13708 RepID=A0AAD8JXT0_TARER|nr:hypothetical protein QVD17_37220 [Tagetes erecta]